MGVTDELLAAVKNYLNITWEDEATDQKIRGIIGAGMDYLTDKAGGCPDFESPGQPQQLLLEYCRYVRDSALDVFESNYRALILGMQHKRAVSQYVDGAI